MELIVYVPREGIVPITTPHPKGRDGNQAVGLTEEGTDNLRWVSKQEIESGVVSRDVVWPIMRLGTGVMGSPEFFAPEVFHTAHMKHPALKR